MLFYQLVPTAWHSVLHCSKNDRFRWNQQIFHTRNIHAHWDQVTHICTGHLTIIGSDKSSSPGRHQAIIWTNVGIMLIAPLGNNSNDIRFDIHIFPFKEFHLNMSSVKLRPFWLGLNVLITHSLVTLIFTVSVIFVCPAACGKTHIFPSEFPPANIVHLERDVPCLIFLDKKALQVCHIVIQTFIFSATCICKLQPQCLKCLSTELKLHPPVWNDIMSEVKAELQLSDHDILCGGVHVLIHSPCRSCWHGFIIIVRVNANKEFAIVRWLSKNDHHKHITVIH